ncbi:MAG: serine/threonine-protein kinase [Microbacteriaceae bacterium]|nr:serine/threonine-protein kinase [Microbacteriaceae bacterium]NBS61338.1 serine/threonine-protein kinase [Microbacteriaceae bacterium]
MSNLTGKTLSARYLIQDVVARGGMSTVYLAKDLRLDRVVAIKVIHPHLAADPVFRDKFFREARMLAKVNHANLVNIYDQGDDSGNAYIVLEYVQGITLRDALRDSGALTTEQIVQVSKAVLSALSQAHSNGIVHRDLKPENVLLSDDGRIKVTDFGLARELSADTDTGSLVGTVAYLAPEVIKRGKTQTQSDIYSYGIMLFEMLTGKQPFSGTDAIQVAMMHTSSRVGSALSENSSASKDLDELMLYCTEPDAGNRPKDAELALRALEKISATKTANIDETLVLDDPHGDLSFTEVISDFDIPTETAFEEHSKKSPVTKWLVASILTLSLGAFGGWWFGAGPGALIAVPNVSDKTQSQAINSLQTLTETIEIRKVFSSTFAEGQVVGTEPPAGIPVTKGTPITLLVSKGKEMAVVPDLLGNDLVTASAKLVGARFTVGAVSEWFNADYPLGSVYAYSGDDKTELAIGSTIEMKISLGAIPIVAGLKEDVARAALEVAGLSVRKSNYQFSDSIAKGEVIAVAPDEVEVGKGSTVKLIVSKGPNTVVMPEVVGETILAAQGLLESLGLEVLIDTKWLSADYGIKRVTGASENVGEVIKVGSTVIIRSR